jgi:hypothetical protein
MKTTLLTALIGTLLSGASLAAPTATGGIAPAAAGRPVAVISLAEILGTPVNAGFELKLPGAGFQVTAACKCEEWTVIKYRPCLEYSADGTRCVKQGPEEKRKCCSRTSCGQNEC